MFVNLIKFIHLVFVLALLVSTFFCIYLLSAKNLIQQNTSSCFSLRKINRLILYFSLATMLTGTFLVYPKYFTFHTPWIRAAYLLLTLFCLSILFINKKNKSEQLSRFDNILFKSIYFLLMIILILIVHDAVMKMTFLAFG